MNANQYFFAALIFDYLDFIKNIKGSHVTKFKTSDVMRHKIVKDIIKEYEKRKK